MRTAFALLVLVVFIPVVSAQEAEALLRDAEQALKRNKAEEALKLADRAAAAGPSHPAPQYVRGLAYEQLGKNAEAVAAYDKALSLDKSYAAAYQARGGAHFKLGHIKESLADFDRFLELRPERRESHWQRGISLYYAGRYDDGRDQFKLGDKVYANDVENAAWHYLCNARAHGVERARKEILKIGKDARIPLMEVYALYQGKATPEDVLAAAKAGQPSREELKERLFYGHLYLGLYYEAAGDKKKALEHMALAADDYRIGHYMGDVARVHRDILKKQEGAK